jgi:hypothetical protein
VVWVRETVPATGFKCSMSRSVGEVVLQSRYQAYRSDAMAASWRPWADFNDPASLKGARVLRRRD